MSDNLDLLMNCPSGASFTDHRRCSFHILFFQSGFFFFTIMNDYSAGLSLSVALLLEALLIAYVYGRCP